MLLGLFFRKNIGQLDDQALLELVRARNEQAMGELFVRYSYLVMGQCLKYLKDKMLAEDEMMNIFDKLPEKISRSEISNFKSWLYSVSKNECLMKLRKKGIKEADAETALLYAADEADETLKLAELNEAKMKLLETAMDDLNEEQKKCIRLFYLEHKSYDEIVKLTPYDLNKVKSHIQNGKRNLKLMLEKQREFKD
ncbi:MAG: sigma-70 family RNA polymerase sigma factor [Bacteroidetes bacterium]|nr:sigma-70 family RNA polymerase sigma factor [Bacteroidota bacterium]